VAWLLVASCISGVAVVATLDTFTLISYTQQDANTQDYDYMNTVHPIRHERQAVKSRYLC
jgi:hypothetical protein